MGSCGTKNQCRLPSLLYDLKRWNQMLVFANKTNPKQRLNDKAFSPHFFLKTHNSIFARLSLCLKGLEDVREPEKDALSHGIYNNILWNYGWNWHEHVPPMVTVLFYSTCHSLSWKREVNTILNWHVVGNKDRRPNNTARRHCHLTVCTNRLAITRPRAPQTHSCKLSLVSVNVYYPGTKGAGFLVDVD